MPSTIVILSHPQDLHAHAMCETLERKRARARFVFTPDFPESLGFSICVDHKGATLSSHGDTREELGSECTSVWLRRPRYAKIPKTFDPLDQQVIERECRDMRRSFFDLLCPSALWVNPLQSAFSDRFKPAQLLRAQHCGLKIPPTLFSNDPEEIVKFVESAPTFCSNPHNFQEPHRKHAFCWCAP